MEDIYKIRNKIFNLMNSNRTYLRCDEGYIEISYVMIYEFNTPKILTCRNIVKGLDKEETRKEALYKGILEIVLHNYKHINHKYIISLEPASVYSSRGHSLADSCTPEAYQLLIEGRYFKEDEIEKYIKWIIGNKINNK